ncbi:uncharacterized protein LOC8039305 [Ixodes scapularis]|uniref:Deltamethrin resistance protein prag01 domain-containing protein n=1 Tax=Ixodes scapularis TaxID=6945 RepID=B7QCR9_IXOSC|nr:uncharacterized protein LOC8039305 [Ixodes scapularis]EEC16641.1 conserved hypothetical protein [Ixodes scapularis]|eukprot:XP_002413333.1 conserved hypothetical protein [Ixodes scapularis]
MIARLAAQRTLQCMLRRPAARPSTSYAPDHFKPPTMDDLPKFLGPWEEHYAKRQAKFNMQLAAAVAFFLTTSFVVYSLDIVDFVDPPPMKNKD